MNPEYELDEDKLKLVCINFSDEIVGDNEFLMNEDVTIFNSSILQLNKSDDLLIASRGWYGNIRSWDGINFVIMSLFTKDFKKKKQKILGIDTKSLKDKKIKFKDFKATQHEIIPHGDKLLKGPEDPRLFYLKDDIYILINDLTDSSKRHMFVGKVDLKTLEYAEPIELCESLSTRFEKNWGPFIHEDKLHMVYDINPLKVFEIEDDFKCELKFDIKNEILKQFTESFPDLHFHIRNSTNLIHLKDDEYLGLGHGVLDYKGHEDINKYLIPLFGKSKYSDSDKDYFNRFFKLYTGFFYKLDMNKQEITYMSPFFQLPNKESKQELIFFPTSISLDSDNYVNISYNVGDNRSYFVKLHLDIINISLYNKENIEFLVNLNINLNYYTELIRNIRKLLGFSTKKKEYYKFGDVNKIFSSSGKIKKKTRRKTSEKKNKKKKKDRKTRINRIKKKKLIYFHMDGCDWCKKFEPVWSKLKKSVKDVKYMKINGPKNETMKDKYGVRTYPSLVKIDEDSHELFSEERTLKNIKDFLK